MFKKTQLTMMVAAIMISALTFASCSADGEGETADAVVVVEQAQAVPVTEPPVEIVTEQTVETTELPEQPVQMITMVNDMVIDGTKLYAVSEGAAIFYDIADKSRNVVAVDDNLTSIAVHQGVVYIGGRELYTFDGETLDRQDWSEAGNISFLYSDDEQLMIGTEQGLFAYDGAATELLLADVSVSAIVADESGLWVGTDGQGLYRWDGEEFRKRYLLRDPDMFDTVTALDFNHQHLYMGTTNGFHIYNGGRWLTLTTDEGMPANYVRTIDASAWVVYVGTEEGVVSWFAGDLRPVGKLESQKVNRIVSHDQKLYVTTDYKGILRQSRYSMNVLVPPILDSTIDILSLIP